MDGGLVAGYRDQPDVLASLRSLSAGFEKSPSHPDHALSKRMRTAPSDSKLTNLFLDMLAAEQGAGDNTLDAYRRDLTDFSEFLGRKKQNFASAGTDALRDYLA